jgi:anti-sigma factor RsiW
MHVDHHQEIRNIIDRSLVGTASLQEEQALREHLLTCSACQEYLNASHRAIAALAGFSFEVNPQLHGKVAAALTLRAQQLQANKIKQRPMWWSYVAALLLTVIGSLAAVQFSGLAVAIFHLEPAPWHVGLLALWIVPSLCLCLLFPVLHRLSAGRMNEKGLSQ